MKKKLIGTALVLLVLLIAAVVAVSLSLDKIIRHAVITAGPAITKVEVKLDSVDLSLLSGSGALHGFALGNPAGYSAPTCMEFGTASLSLEPASLMSDKVVIHHVRLEAPVVTFEGGLRGNNLNDLMKGMQSGEDKPATGAEETPGEQAAQRKLQVDEFSLTGAKLIVKIKELGGEPKTLVLPDIKMTNLGTGPEGITASELTKLILKQITEKALVVVLDSGGDLNKIGEAALQELNKSGNQDTEKAVRGVLDLFKKKE